MIRYMILPQSRANTATPAAEILVHLNNTWKHDIITYNTRKHSKLKSHEAQFYNYATVNAFSAVWWRCWAPAISRLISDITVPRWAYGGSIGGGQCSGVGVGTRTGWSESAAQLWSPSMAAMMASPTCSPCSYLTIFSWPRRWMLLATIFSSSSIRSFICFVQSELLRPAGPCCRSFFSVARAPTLSSATYSFLPPLAVTSWTPNAP